MMSAQYTKELVYIDNLNARERRLLEDIIMMVFSDDVFCICLEGAVNKLVIVRIGRNKSQMIINLNHPCIRQIKYCLNNVGCNLWPNLLSQYFLILSQYLIGDAKCVFPVNEISPDGIISAASRERHQQAVGVKNYIHYCLYGVRMCS